MGDSEKKSVPGEAASEETPAGESADGSTEPKGKGEPDKIWDLDEDVGASGSAGALEEKDREIAELKEKSMRAYAELENFKKRTQREKAEQLRYANESILKELLPVLDNLERAIEHIKGEPEVSQWGEGVELTHRQCLEALKKFGVVPIKSLGEAFDPNHHQAMTFIETSELPENTVAEELQRGYLHHERVLRPAMVAVAKNPSKEDSGDGEKAGAEEESRES
ncbi:MAG TPA: nucleotide exchange factor GrpE [Nitrospiria bacterium]